MSVTLIQPQNAEGKYTPMCAFDPKNGYIGHEFRSVGERTAEADGYVQKQPIVVCTRCGVLWEVSHD